MLLIREQDVRFPDWSPLKEFSVHTVREGEPITFSSRYPASAIFVVSGRVFITADDKEYTLNSWQSPTDGLILNTGRFTAKTYSAPGFWRDRCTFYVFHGDWKEAGIGLFRISRCDRSILTGLPADYHKNTCYPAHADDFDQAWLVTKGHGVVQSDSASYPMEQGNLLLIRAGELHDFAVAHSYTECIRLSIK